MTRPPRKVLAVASGGGHWVQLRRITPVLDAAEIVYVTVDEAYQHDEPGRRVHVVNDSTRWDKVGLVGLLLRIAGILLRERPELVISTGAAPGCLAVVLGRLLGARTIWVDSIANVATVSLSGRLARPFAQLWLTQWPHLATSEGPEYAGSVT